MLLAIALSLAGHAAEQSDLALTRDAFAGLCGNLTSETAVMATGETNGWVAVAPDPKRAIGSYYAMAASWGPWKGTAFHAYRKLVAGHTMDALVFNVANSQVIGAGLHCIVYMDDGRTENPVDVIRWGKTEPRLTPEPAGGRLLQWRDPGVFATHAITTVELAPPSGAGIEIWSIGVLSAATKN